MSPLILAMAILSSPAPVPTSYGIVECSGWPLSRGQLAASGVRVVRAHQRPGRILLRLWLASVRAFSRVAPDTQLLE